MGELTTRLALTADPKERKRLKAAAHAAAGAPAPFTVRGTRVEVLSGPTLVLIEKNGEHCIELTLRFTKRGKDVTPPDFNPWRIHNPPLLVPDPAGEVETIRRDRDGSQKSERWREDPAAALRQMIADVVT